MKTLLLILLLVPMMSVGQAPSIEWETTYGGLDYDGGNSVQQTTDGGYIMTGSTYSFGNNGQVYLIKTDANGNQEWAQTYGEVNDDEIGADVKQTSDGGYIITGLNINGSPAIERHY